MNTGSQHIEICHRAQVSFITINRTERGNAVDVGMQCAIVAELQAAAVAGDIKALVLTGAGSRTFCGGIDFSEQSSESDLEASQRRSAQMLVSCLAIVDCPKPVIAAVNGHAVGAGCLFAFLCDARIAAPNATFSLPEIQLGQPTLAGVAIIGNMLGEMAACDLVQSGRRMNAAEALERHLLAAVRDHDQLIDEAQGLARRLAAPLPLAFALNKRAIFRDCRTRLEAASAESNAVRASVFAERKTFKAAQQTDTSNLLLR